jgi:hypothetical protein
LNLYNLNQSWLSLDIIPEVLQLGQENSIGRAKAGSQSSAISNIEASEDILAIILLQ